MRTPFLTEFPPLAQHPAANSLFKTQSTLYWSIFFHENLQFCYLWSTSTLNLTFVPCFPCLHPSGSDIQTRNTHYHLGRISSPFRYQRSMVIPAAQPYVCLAVAKALEAASVELCPWIRSIHLISFPTVCPLLGTWCSAWVVLALVARLVLTATSCQVPMTALSIQSLLFSASRVRPVGNTFRYAPGSIHAQWCLPLCNIFTTEQQISKYLGGPGI